MKPRSAALAFARHYGFILHREPFGKRGSLIEIYHESRPFGYRKSWNGALNVMKRIIKTREA